MKGNVIQLYPAGMSDFDKRYLSTSNIFDADYLKKAKKAEQKKRLVAEQKETERLNAIRKANTAKRKANKARMMSGLLSCFAISAMAVTLIAWHLMGVF